MCKLEALRQLCVEFSAMCKMQSWKGTAYIVPLNQPGPAKINIGNQVYAGPFPYLVMTVFVLGRGQGLEFGHSSVDSSILHYCHGYRYEIIHHPQQYLNICSAG